MLTLSRKKNEWLWIKCPGGAIIKILVVGAGDGKAKIGIDAPREFQIARKEEWLNEPGKATT